MSEKKSTRVQLELPERSMNRLLVLKDKTEATSYAEVIRSALHLYEILLKDVAAGGELLIRTPEGAVSRYHILGLEDHR